MEQPLSFIPYHQFYQWCYDFIKTMPSFAKTKDICEVMRQYNWHFHTFILDKVGAKEYDAIIVDGLLEGVRHEVKRVVELHEEYMPMVAEEVFQYNFRNFQREWKKYGMNNYRTAGVTSTATFIFDGVRNKIKESCGSLDKFEVYLGLKLIEFLLLEKYHPFLMEREEHRRRLREEEKALRELQREKERAEKDVEKANAAIKKNEAALDKAKTSAQVKKLKQQIEELKVALQRAEERRDRAISMAQQTRCGYVYVISNIGSFGEDVYKIGMTRRIDPMQRVRELGDASVPYPFDVHAMIYTEDAPALESHLHRVFDLYKLNTMNWRKEYFRVPLSAIREEVEKFGIRCDWKETPAAEQYRDSEWMRTIGNLDAAELQDFWDEHPEEYAKRSRPMEYDPFDHLDDGDY